MCGSKGTSRRSRLPQAAGVPPHDRTVHTARDERRYPIIPQKDKSALIAVAANVVKVRRIPPKRTALVASHGESKLGVPQKKPGPVTYHSLPPVAADVNGTLSNF